MPIIPLLILALLAAPATAGYTVPELLQAKLITAGWTSEASQAVVNSNAEFFTNLANTKPTEWQRVSSDLQQLVRFPSWMGFLARRPEAAALAINAQDPRLLYRVLSSISPACWPWLFQQYTYVPASHDAMLMTQTLDLHQQRICELAKLGVPNPALIFFYPTTQPGAKEYTKWLDQMLIKPALREVWTAKDKTKANEALAVAITFALTQGPEIRRRMARDADFRQRFTTLWTALDQALDDAQLRTQKLILAAAEPHIWDLLLLKHGAAIIKDWGTDVPITLLFGPMAVPQDLQPLVVEALSQGHVNIIELLLTHLGDQNLYNLMRRKDLDRYHIERILHALEGPCPHCPDDYSARLDYFKNLQPVAIANQFISPARGLVTWVPFYKELSVVERAMQGRHVTMTEWGLLSLSVLSTAYTLGGMATVMLPNTGTLATSGSSLFFSSHAANSVASVKTSSALQIATEQLLGSSNLAALGSATTTAKNFISRISPFMQPMCNYVGGLDIGTGITGELTKYLSKKAIKAATKTVASTAAKVGVAVTAGTVAAGAATAFAAVGTAATVAQLACTFLAP